MSIVSTFKNFVIPAKAGIHLLPPRFRPTGQVMGPRLCVGDTCFGMGGPSQ
jgi:hypothetical protein